MEPIVIDNFLIRPIRKKGQILVCGVSIVNDHLVGYIEYLIRLRKYGLIMIMILIII